MIWLEDFAALAGTGNFSRAAVLRHVTQPAFSRRIRALEDWIGVPLFDREAQPVTLTTAGRRFEPAAQDMLRRIAQTRDDVREAARSQTAALRFAATHVLSFTFFPAWFHRLEDGRAPTTVHLMSDSFLACEQRMLLGHVQFLLCHHHAAAPTKLDAARFPSVEVGTDALCLVAAPATAQAASAAPLLAYSPESGLGRIVAAAGRPSADARPVFTSHLAAALRTVALDGRGVAWLPLSLIQADLAAGTLVRVARPDTDITLAIHVFRPAVAQDKAAEAFWDRLCDGETLSINAHSATERPVSNDA
ncbi:LysR family transcriptional regulator, partial [Beijerinckia sp. L45]|uniref:LysR family transcriptional regulator n=1 Tax=Beijerinckia sp. L45 TaxID=1641855 RepID=UPI00131CBA00